MSADLSSRSEQDRAMYAAGLKCETFDEIATLFFLYFTIEGRHLAGEYGLMQAIREKFNAEYRTLQEWRADHASS